MVITPGISDLPYRIQVDGTKLFTLTAEEITWELVNGIFIQVWGYNGSTPGPTIRVFPGDRVCIRVINRLPEKKKCTLAWLNGAKCYGWCTTY